jgi:hypothetical protein
VRKLLMGSAVQKTMDAEVRTLDILKRVLEIWPPGGPASIRSG